ncbi:MAG TPA: c-type cytochrome [Burkholderiales bacterium]|nr:c-type cytochrome [Burkholderiales bacterium]
MIRVLAISASVALLWAGAARAQDGAKPDPAKGQNIVSQVCAACHGPDGNSVAPANPKLAGQFSEYLYKQLRNFKAQDGKKAERENPIMAGMVANLSEPDMRNVAAYFSEQKLRPDVARDKDLAAAGQKLYRGGNAATGVVACAGCHGPSGAGIPIEFPHIAGQYADYVESQLKAFRSGARANDPNGMMRGVAARMTDDEIKAVAQYVAGLR